MTNEGRARPDSGADEYVLAAANGDPVATRKLVDATLPFVHRMIWRLVGRRQEADDLVQMVYVRALSSLADFRAGSAFSTWLGAICVNVARTHWASRPRTDPNAEPLELMSVHSSDDTEAVVLARQGLRAVQGALATLTPKLREAFVLHVLEERDIATVAAMTDSSTAATYKAVARARELVDKFAEKDPYLKKYLDRRTP